MNHVAVIPARAGSVGFPGKNRLFFSATADLIDHLPWISRAIVSTDDDEIVSMARAREYDPHPRPPHLAGAAVSIKDVFRCVASDMRLAADDVMWLFYLTILHKDAADFEMARLIVERDRPRSLISFVPAAVHPWTCWSHDPKTRLLSQYVANDAFRRQDRPPAWRYYHYLCCCRADEIETLNSELIGPTTYPVFLDQGKADVLVEIDTLAELEAWRQRQGQS